MITETDRIVSFAPHVPTGEAANLAAYIPQLPPEVYDMAGLIDNIYIVTTPLYGLMFGAMVFFLRRILKQFDRAIDKLELLTEKSIRNETVLNGHIADDRIHDFSRRKQDV
jgi:hypothetical protein